MDEQTLAMILAFAASMALLGCVTAVVTAVGWRLAPSYAGRGWARRPRRTA